MNRLKTKPNLLYLIAIRSKGYIPTEYLTEILIFPLFIKFAMLFPKFRTVTYLQKIKRTLSSTVVWKTSYYIADTQIRFAEGDILKFLNGRLHCDDRPAIIYTDKHAPIQIIIGMHTIPYKYSMRNGVEYWQHGKRHRIGGPACIFTDGKPHRVNGPAFILKNYEIVEMWEQYGERHREDGPAVTYANGDTEWYFKGEYHRIGGPAKEWIDGSYEWWLNGMHHRDDELPAVSRNGVTEYWFQGKKHRIGGPAVLYNDGHDDQYWRDGVFMGYCK